MNSVQLEIFVFVIVYYKVTGNALSYGSLEWTVTWSLMKLIVNLVTHKARPLVT